MAGGALEPGDAGAAMAAARALWLDAAAASLPLERRATGSRRAGGGAHRGRVRANDRDGRGATTGGSPGVEPARVGASGAARRSLVAVPAACAVGYLRSPLRG